MDWFTKSYKKVDENGTVFHMEGDGKGQDWEHSLSIPDFALDVVMGSKIPEEPSYIIINTAISSTWAFPYNLPDWCPKCYDCSNPKCTCSFNPGFCNMMKTGKVAFKVDSVRVYQSKNDTAHDGNPHTVGCDPVEFPTREFIRGYEYRYMRNPPFVYEDRHPLREVKRGGGECVVDGDCGGEDEVPIEKDAMNEIGDEEEDVVDLDNVDDVSGGASSSMSTIDLDDSHENAKTKPKMMRARRNRRLKHETSDTMDTKKSDSLVGGDGASKLQDDSPGLNTQFSSTEPVETDEANTQGSPNSLNRKSKGSCAPATYGLFGVSTSTTNKRQCKCNEGYTGPYCLTQDKHDDAPGAYDMKKVSTLFSERANPYLTRFHVFFGGLLVGAFLVFWAVDGVSKKREMRRVEMITMKNRS